MSDRLSPILVKELRQGMRARAFEGSFLLLQVLMLFAVVMAVAAVSSRNSNLSFNLAEGLFWTMLAIPVLLIMPMRGCTALRNEIDGKSLELIFLTRLTAWRIVFGKWGALFSQTCLLVVAVLPYAVLRYYLGSVDLLGDVVIIGGMLGASALLTALTVSLSGFHAKLARGMVFIFPLVILMFGPSLVVGLAMAVRRSSGVFAFVDWQVYLAILFYGLAGLYYLLEIGAARIAPPAENHAIRKRLVGLLLLLSGPIAVGLGADKFFLWLPLILVTPICLDALARQWNPIPGTYLPLLRWGQVARGAAPALLPGWPSGFIFTIGVLALYAPVLFLAGELGSDRTVIGYIALVGALVMPLAVIRVFLPRTQQIGAAYFVIQLTVFILTMLVVLFDNLFNLEILEVLSVLPLSTLIMAVVGEADSGWVVPTAAMTLISIFLIIFRSGAYWREVWQIRNEGRILALSTAAAQSPGREDAG